MAPLTLVDATDLDNWSDRRQAQDTLPQLIRRLVLATLVNPRHVSFRAGEGVQLAGWDGVVDSDDGNAFVPAGVSGWELSTRKGKATKADDDYSSRASNPLGLEPSETTFISVTSRRWKGKKDWAAERRADGIWRDVRAYDADDLETWLETARGVHLWLSLLLGKPSHSAITLETYWEDLVQSTDPPVADELLPAGRDGTVDHIHEWLSADPEPLYLLAESRDEAIAVFAAAVAQLPEERRLSVSSRTIIVRDAETWTYLCATGEELTLVRDYDDTAAAARASRSGHHVVVPLGISDHCPANTHRVPRLSRHQASEALRSAGVGSNRAGELAALARRSFKSLMREIATSPDSMQPEWAGADAARSLLPILFAGAWDNSNDADRRAVEALGGSEYGEVADALVRWSTHEDPPVRRIGDAWLIVSKADSWRLIARFLTADDVRRFEYVVFQVLNIPDPRFDLPQDERWSAGAYGYTHPCSEHLRGGLVDTLAAMGAQGEELTLSSGTTVRDAAGHIVQRLLQAANDDWRLWASLAHWLPLLAEAAPDEFLEAVEAGLEGEYPTLRTLFTDQGDRLFSSSPHTGLLWALETLAWCPDYLGRVSHLLARLAEIDPGGRLHNRPENSLRSVFLLWHPQTSAGIDQRLRVIDSLREHAPEVAWALMLRLLPDFGDHTSSNATPRWQDWASSAPPAVTRAEFAYGIQEILVRCMEDAAADGERWADLVGRFRHLPSELRASLLQRLIETDAELVTSEGRAAIWHALRKVVSYYRSFHSRDDPERQKNARQVEEVLDRYEPGDPVERNAWLFDHDPELLQGRVVDWTNREQQVRASRHEAVCAIYSSGGLNGVLDLAESAEQPFYVGLEYARCDPDEPEVDTTLSQHLASENSARAQLAYGLAVGCAEVRGREWVIAKLESDGLRLNAAQRAYLLSCLPAEAATWDLVSNAGAQTEREYWSRFNLPVLGDPALVERATSSLCDHGRAIHAVRVLSMHLRRGDEAPATLIAATLEQAVASSPDEGVPPPNLGYWMLDLLERLTECNEIDEHRVAQLEWALLPLLSHGEHRPTTLHRELGRNPEFFVDLVKLVYRAEGDERQQLSVADQAKALHAFELLTSWRTVPGSDEDGNVDSDALRDWVRRAREYLSGSGRALVGDEQIGQLLSGSPDDPDGAWPHAAVRDVIEDVRSPALEKGIEIGRFNSRGSTWRCLEEGGAQERSIADEHDRHAALVADRWPRTATMLRRMRDAYLRDARREDDYASLRQDLE